MADADRSALAKPPAQAVVYLFPERVFLTTTQTSFNENTFVFQYWPESLSDSQPVNYAVKEIPGGSHPLYQYVGGGERTISFDAVFTSEVEDPAEARRAAIPSSRYSVDIRAAVARIESFKQPSYQLGGNNGRVIPPSRLVLVMPGTNLGREEGVSDEILVVLKDVSWSYESWFPNGVPRVVTASMTFAESIQSLEGNGSRIRFRDRADFGRDFLRRYNFYSGNQFV